MDIWKKVLVTLLVGLCMAPLAMGDYAYTPVTFTVASSLAFTVTLPGQGPVSSSASSPGTATTTIYFNSSSISQNNIQPCANPDFATNCQSSPSTPIFNFTNTGTATYNMTIKYNTTLTTGIVSAYNSSCSAGCTANATQTALDTDWHRPCQALPPSADNWCAVWLYANFTDLAAGSYTNQLYQNSTLAIVNP